MKNQLVKTVQRITWQTIAKLPLAFEDLTGLDRPLWRDNSKHNGFVNYEIAKANGVQGTAIRSTISWAYKDPLFTRNYHEAGRVGIYRTSYHVIYPDQPLLHKIGADGRIVQRGQLDNWYEAHPELDIIPRIIDLELQRGVSWSEIAEIVWRMCELILGRDGVYPIIYARKNLIDTWLQSWTPEMINSIYWWLAQYLWDRVREHPNPDLPARMDPNRLVLHQTADKKPAFSGEVESLDVDWDRWEQGNVSQMHEFIRTTWGGETPPPPVDDYTRGREDMRKEVLTLNEQYKEAIIQL